ncbi:hypothetical protein SD960_08315 [Flavobacterium sp. MMLR14_040]|uniref:hypothetical protein n=1 Tax=Flavobacterium sp. MMLR14_040 TaxID=3093843 RepID=UPI00298FE945|nr:hypothetical protein [Flavobacterium sp. MMLR14_040]MDW8850090.1 hypothetical protein [Flavobacterium sp. MMLR14_040]
MKKVFLSFGMLIVFGLTSIIFNSCNNDDGNGGEKNTNNNLSSITIQNSKALFISSSKEGSKLYGVKSSAISGKSTSGTEVIFEIKYLNSAGEEIQKSDPAYIYNLKDFIVLGFGASYLINSGFDEAYLIKKSDGKVFEIPRKYMPHVVGNKYDYLHQYLNTENKIQEDKNNNIYYTTYPDHKILKVSLNTPSLLQFQEISAVNDNVYGFCVDGNGNIHYGYYDSNTQDYKYRYRKSEGNFINTTFPEGKYYNRIWTGTDGQIYGAKMNTVDDSYLGKIQDGGFLVIKQSKMNINDWKFGNVFNVKGKIIYTYYEYNPNKFFNLSNEMEFTEIPCSVKANYVLNDDLYNFDKATFVLTLINVLNGNTSVVYDLDETKLGNYDIDKIINVDQDGVTFSAVDLNNGQYVVAKISISNLVTIQTNINGLITTVTSLN